MEKYKKIISSNLGPFSILIIFILVSGFVIRGYWLANNFIIGSDAARDLMIVSQAIERREMPPIGPFSSAGPFVTGPIYYWILIISAIIFPIGFYNPWFLLILLSVLNILILSYAGYLIRGKRLAVLLGLLSAASYQLIHVSLNLTNPTFIPILVSLLILLFVLLIKKKKVIFAFLLGLALGAAINMHYQALNLLIFIPIIFLIRGASLKNKLIWIFFAILGFLILMLPILIWDFQNNFSNTLNIFDYLLVKQYEIYVPNSWKIYILKDMVSFWGNAVGGFRIFGFMGIIIVGLGAIVGMIKYRSIKDKPEIYLIPLVFFILLLVNRFYHGERSEIYLIYLTPFILFTVSLSFDLLLDKAFFTQNKISHGIIYLIFTTFILGSVFAVISNSVNDKWRMSIYYKAVNTLVTKYPDKKFTIYDYNGRNPFVSMPFRVVLAKEGLESANGIKIALTCIPSDKCSSVLEPIAKVDAFPVTNISTFSARRLKDEFQLINEELIYDSLMGWANRHELTHTFSFSEYYKSKLR